MSKKQKKIKSKKTKKFDRVSGILYSSNKRKDVVNKYFDDLSAKEIFDSFSKIKNHRFFKDIVNIYDDSNYEWIYLSASPDIREEKSLYWSLSIVLENIEKIQTFIAIEEKITKKILIGEYESCIGLLDELDLGVGISLWSIETRGTIYSLMGDDEKKSDYRKHLLTKVPEDDLFYRIANITFNKYEDTELFSLNVYSLRTQIERSFDGKLLNFLLNRVCIKNFYYDYDYWYIFNMVRWGPVVDLYLMIVDYLVSFGDDEKKTHTIKFVVSKLCKKINTPPISVLANKFGIRTEWVFNSDDYRLLDLYTVGSYCDLISYFKNNRDCFSEFQHYELVSKSVARTDELSIDGLGGQIIKSLAAVLTRGDGYDKERSYLLNLCYGFSSLRWFRELHLFIESESGALDERKREYVRSQSILHSAVISPRKYEVCSSELAGKFIDNACSSIKDSVTLMLYRNKDDFHKSLSIQGLGIEESRSKKYFAKSLIKSSAYRDAVPILKELVLCGDVLIGLEASRVLVDVLLELGDVEDALKEFAEKCLLNQNLLGNYNTDRICSYACSIVSSSSSIYVPISLSLHSEFVDNKYDSALRYSFECYLVNNGIVTPLETVDSTGYFSELAINYYLDKVCTSGNMKLYLGFSGSKDMEYCRIDICNHLIDRGVDNKESLIHEVKEITKKLFISEATKHVENSKIYSDDSVFYSESGRKKFEKLYERFMDLRGNDYSYFADELQLSIYCRLGSVYDLKSHPELQSTQVLNEKNATFTTLMLRMRDEFTHGDKGLKTFLSTRIRHGYLPNMFRKSVYEESLLTKKDVSRNAFKSNLFWLERLCLVAEKHQKKIDNLFIAFSGAYEAKITEVNDQWLQFHILDQLLTNLSDQVSNPDALFDFSVSNVEAYYLQQTIPAAASYSEFTKHIVDWLWDRTDHDLSLIRDKFSTDVKRVFIGLLDGLQRDIYELVQCEALLSDLNDSISRARTALAADIDQMVMWFTRTSENAVLHYDIDTAVEIAKVAASVSVCFEKDKSYCLRGNTLSYFVDFLYIFIENAISKSNLPKTDVGLEVNVKTIDGVFCVEVINNCNLLSSIEEENSKLKFYKDNYGIENIPRENIQGVGGTGFFKVWNILFRALGLTHRIQFYYTEENKFYVKVEFYDFWKVMQNENSIS